MTQPLSPAAQLPPDYIDEWIQGEDRKLLEIYHTAELSEGGSGDEVILRGIKAVLAHPSQMVEIEYQGRLFRMRPGGKIVIERCPCCRLSGTVPARRAP